jgi:hypothetical protein
MSFSVANQAELDISRNGKFRMRRSVPGWDRLKKVGFAVAFPGQISGWQRFTVGY